MEPEVIVDLKRALGCEEKDDRLIFRLFYEQGYATHEIAQQVGMSPGAVRIRLCRVRRRIREQMGTTAAEEFPSVAKDDLN